MFDEKPSCALIIQGNNNRIPPMNSNHGGRVNGQESSPVDKKTFQMAPQLLSANTWKIYTIRLKYGLIIPFNAIFC